VNNIIPATPGGGVPGIAGQPTGPIVPPPPAPVFNPVVNTGPALGSSGNVGGGSSSNSSTSLFGLSRATLIVVTLGVLLLLGVGIAGVVVAFVKNQPKKPRRRPRRRRLDDDY